MNLQRSEPVVLRQLRLEGEAASIGRARGLRTAAPASLVEDIPPVDPMPALREAAREEGLRQGREEGWRAGHQEGLAAGRAEAAKAAGAAIAAAVDQATQPLRARERALAEITVRLEASVTEVLRAADEQLLALCHEAIGGILGRALLSRDGLQAQVRTLLGRTAQQGAVAVHLHPQDLQRVQDGAAPSANEANPIAWLADPQVALGGCIVQAAQGALDARLETLMSELQTMLLAARDDACAGQEPMNAARPPDGIRAIHLRRGEAQDEVRGLGEVAE